MTFFSENSGRRFCCSVSKRHILTLATFLASVCLSTADIPRKVPLTRYTSLWTNSPFTAKPPPSEAGPRVNPLDDYTLTGIAPVPGGYRITIINKKNPEDKEVIEPGRDNKFTVVSVNRNPDKALGTTVVLAAGSVQGTVTFERELLTLKAAPAAPQQNQQNQNLPPGVNPAQQQQQGGAAQRQPRPRIVAPPAPQGNNNQQQAQPNNRGSSRGQRGQRGDSGRIQRRR